jgi:hypothetical protein
VDRHLTQNLGVNLAGVRILFELEERLGTRILERLYSEGAAAAEPPLPEPSDTTTRTESKQAAAASAAKP